MQPWTCFAWSLLIHRKRVAVSSCLRIAILERDVEIKLAVLYACGIIYDNLRNADLLLNNPSFLEDQKDEKQVG